MALVRFAKSFEGLPRSYWVLLVGGLVNRAGSFIVPMLAIYLTDQRHLSMVEAGIIASAFGLGSLLGGMSGGALADRIGRRKTMLISLSTGAMAMLALGMARDFGELLACAFALGILGDMYRPAMQAAMADVVPPALRMKAFTWSYWAINLGFSIAAILGGTLAAHHFRELFIGDALTTLGTAALIFRGVPESKPVLLPSEKRTEGSILTPFRDAKFAPFLFANALLMLVFFQHVVALPLAVRAKGLQAIDFGFASAVNGVLIVILQPFTPALLQGRNRSRTLALAAILVGVGFGMTAFADTLGLLMLSVAVWTLGEILSAPLNSELVAELAPAQLRGRYQGAFGFSISIALMLAPLVSPQIIQQIGFTWFWAACGLVSVFSAAMYLSQKFERPKAS